MEFIKLIFGLKEYYKKDNEYVTLRREYLSVKLHHDYYYFIDSNVGSIFNCQSIKIARDWLKHNGYEKL